MCRVFISCWFSCPLGWPRTLWVPLALLLFLVRGLKFQNISPLAARVYIFAVLGIPWGSIVGGKYTHKTIAHSLTRRWASELDTVRAAGESATRPTLNLNKWSVLARRSNSHEY